MIKAWEYCLTVTVCHRASDDRFVSDLLILWLERDRFDIERRAVLCVWCLFYGNRMVLAEHGFVKCIMKKIRVWKLWYR